MKSIKRLVLVIAFVVAFVYAFNIQYVGELLNIIGNAAVECVSGGDEYSTRLKEEMNTLSVSKFIDLGFVDKIWGKEPTGEGGSDALGEDELVVSDKIFLDEDGNIDWEKWAPNGGRVVGTIVEGVTLPIGTVIDRYGNEYGRYTSPEGTPYGQRALPYIENPNAYHRYKVLKPIENVTVSEIAPAFGHPGGGIQYELPENIKTLIEKGYLKEIE